MRGALAQEKMRIAVLDLTADGVPSRTARTVSDMLRSDLVNAGKFIVIERTQMEAILKEQGFQQSGCTDQECAVQIGKVMSARKMLIGTVSLLGTAFILNVRIVDVENAVVEFAAKEKAESETVLDVAVEGITRKLMERIGVAGTVYPPGSPKNVKATDGAYPDKVVITWSPVSGADYYYVYRSDTEKGEYRELDDTKDTSFTDKKAKPGVSYFYRLKARSKGGYSEFSAADAGHVKSEPVAVIKDPKKEPVKDDKAVKGATGKNPYFMPAAGFSGLTLLTMGTGFYFNMQLSNTQKDYDSLATKYKAATDAATANSLQSKMQGLEKDADKYSLYRNISYGLGTMSFLVTGYFVYKYYTFNPQTSLSYNRYNPLDIVPIVYYGGSGTGQVWSSRPFIGGGIIMRF